MPIGGEPAVTRQQVSIRLAEGNFRLTASLLPGKISIEFENGRAEKPRYFRLSIRGYLRKKSTGLQFALSFCQATGDHADFP
jgi:hypothetical protein